MNGPIARAELELGKTQYRALKQVVHRTTGLKRYEAQIGPWRVPYLRGGKGPKLLLIHGFGDSKTTWAPLILLLYRHFDVIAPDLLGFGDSPVVGSQHMVPREQAQMLLGLLDTFGQEPVHVLGQSMGGMVAAYLALARPERCATLTLVSPAGPAGISPELEQLIARGTNPLLANDLKSFDALLKLSMNRRPPYPRPMRRYLAAQWGERHEEACRHWDRLLGVTLDELRPTEMPELVPRTVLVMGEKERIVHTDNIAIYREWFPRLRTETYKGVGHNPHHEATNKLARTLREHARR
ncbi:MAG: alpha/beta fold hydrolase [Myxococcales bacterium]|nr:alpha/beta fold hydrolase [Myxococcales bacterium]